MIPGFFDEEENKDNSNKEIKRLAYFLGIVKIVIVCVISVTIYFIFRK